MMDAVKTFFVRHSKDDADQERHDSTSDVNGNQDMDNSNPRTLSEMLEMRAKLSPDSILVSYPGLDNSYIDYTAAGLNQFVDRVAMQYTNDLPRRSNSSLTPAILALLGPASFDFFVTMHALWKLGHTVLLLSPRLSTNAYVHLLKEVDASGIICDTNFAETAQAVQAELSHLSLHDLVLEDAYETDHDSERSRSPIASQMDLDVETENIAAIIHSSGSTGMPKPIGLSHKGIVGAARNNMNMRAFCCIPFFHAFGLNTLNRAVFSGKRVWMYSAALPMTQKFLIQTIASKQPEILFCVPYTLKLLAESQEGIDVLKTCRLVWFGGSACPDDLGDLLTEQGVKLVSEYGSSECGALLSTLRPDGDQAWNYLRPYAHVRSLIKWEEKADGLYELVCLKGIPWMKATNRPDGFATNDLFEKHPTIENAYRFVARQDDTLVLSNGEKANPNTLEAVVRQHPLLSEAIVFGANKPELGLIVIKSPQGEDLDDDKLMEAVWPAIEQGQKNMPGYGKISKSMVFAFSHHTEPPRTLKGTVVRQLFYKQFHDEIESAYNEPDDSEQLEVDEAGLRDFMRKELVTALGIGESELTDDTDFFRLGVDSLQSTVLRRAIQKNINLGGMQLPSNVVYENPTLKQLASFIHTRKVGGISESPDRGQTVDYFIDKFGDFSSLQQHTHGHSVVLTGATGSLGAHLLAQLVSRPDVRKVYCLVRESGKNTAQERITNSLLSRKVSDSLTDGARAKIHPLSANLSHDRLGLGEGDYEELTQSLTAVIHAAWPVNFNLALSSFEPDIQGTRNLIDLCLAAQSKISPTFCFCSSISTVIESPGVQVEEAVATKNGMIDMGYARSKLVGEHLCMRAAEQTGLRTYVLRIGQITGDTAHGVWNHLESPPMMFQTAHTMHVLPRLPKDECRWLPVDVVAGTTLDITLESLAPAGSVFNIVNPAASNFAQDLVPKLRSAGLDFQEVSMSDWLDRLRNSSQDASINPPIKLLNFFETKHDRIGGDEDAQGWEKNHEWTTINSNKYSDTFRKGWTMDEEFIRKVVTYLRTECWTPKPPSNDSSKSE